MLGHPFVVLRYEKRRKTHENRPAGHTHGLAKESPQYRMAWAYSVIVVAYSRGWLAPKLRPSTCVWVCWTKQFELTALNAWDSLTSYVSLQDRKWEVRRHDGHTASSPCEELCPEVTHGQPCRLLAAGSECVRPGQTSAREQTIGRSVKPWLCVSSAYLGGWSAVWMCSKVVWVPRSCNDHTSFTTRISCTIAHIPDRV